MNAFFAGVVFGALLVACLAVLTFTRKGRRPKRHEIQAWTDEHYQQQPPVVTKITINRRREIEL